MDASAVNDGCGCHGEANSSVGISTEDSELVDEWIPGTTYVMKFLATEAAGPPDEPSAMVHVLVDVGVFNLDGLATGHIIESSQHLRTEEQHNAPRHIRFNWVAPDNTTVENEDITNVTFTIATMLTNDDGTPSDDPWAFVNFTYNKFQHNAGDGNNQQTDTTQGNDGDSDGVGQDQDFVKLMEEAEDEFGVPSDCYSWVYWNTHSVDKSFQAGVAQCTKVLPLPTRGLPS